MRGGFSEEGLAAAESAFTAPHSSSGMRSHGSGRRHSPKDSDRRRLLLTDRLSLLPGPLPVLLLLAAPPAQALLANGVATTDAEACMSWEAWCCGAGDARRQATGDPLARECSFSEDGLRAMLPSRAASMPLPRQLCQARSTDAVARGGRADRRKKVLFEAATDDATRACMSRLEGLSNREVLSGHLE